MSVQSGPAALQNHSHLCGRPRDCKVICVTFRLTHKHLCSLCPSPDCPQWRGRPWKWHGQDNRVSDSLGPWMVAWRGSIPLTHLSHGQVKMPIVCKPIFTWRFICYNSMPTITTTLEFNRLLFKKYFLSSEHNVIFYFVWGKKGQNNSISRWVYYWDNFLPILVIWLLLSATTAFTQAILWTYFHLIRSSDKCSLLYT